MRRALVLAAAVLALLPAAARADGDPASDVLLAEDVFLPYPPNAPGRAMADALRETVKRAGAKGYGVKVALIADRRDLGSVPQLITQPQPYADLLTRELGFSRHAPGLQGPRVLTVLPTGLGGNNLGDRAGDALSDLLPDPDGGGDALARTAIEAVDRLAKADGKAISLPALPDAAQDDTGSGGGVPTPVIFGAPVVVVALAAFVLNRRKYADDEPDGPPAPPS